MSDWRTNAELDMDIRVEQVRLVFISMKNSLYLGIALALVLVLALYSADNSVHLLIWFALVAGGRVICVSYAILALRSGITASNTLKLIWQMCLIKAFEGLTWGALAWIVMGQGSLPEQLLTMASLAGVSGNAVSLLAPDSTRRPSACRRSDNSRCVSFPRRREGFMAVGRFGSRKRKTRAAKRRPVPFPVR